MLFKNFPFCLGLTALAFLALSACGGDSSSGGDTPEKVDKVSTVDKLPDCTEDFEGDTVLVKDVKADYVCADGEWLNVDSLNVVPDKKPESSSSVASEDPDSESSESSSSATSVNSSSDSAGSSDSDDDSSSSDASSERIIQGVTQKGPFLKGAKVKVLELESSRNLVQTGNSFTAVIQDDDGKFRLKARAMIGQFIELQAEGYFRNEVTGGNSSAPLTLYAYTDISKHEDGVVNVNLLTHLEYFRLAYLVSAIKKTFKEAKEQAKNEILDAFYISGKFASSEDLDIFSEGDGNAALLAISVLMQSNLDVASLSERLTDFASDIEEDGEWNDETAKAKIADWASDQDMSGGLSTIRQNVTNWKLGAVPEFEKYVRHFWYTNYGLNDCKTEGEVLAVKNSRSDKYNTAVRYICKSGAWVEASALEKDTYEWMPGEDGELKKGSITDAKYKYDTQLKKWITATENDVALGLGGCTVNKTGTILQSSVDDVFYICKEQDWQVAQEIDYETYGEECSEVGKVIAGAVTATNTYYCTSSGWILVPMGWSWDVPKEARLNPTINYGTLTESKARGGATYKTVTIGDGESVQTWMAENLNYETDKSWCYGAENGSTTANCAVTGRLYTWAAAIDSAALYKDKGLDCGNGKDCRDALTTRIQGVCPDGWHLPSKTEWEILFELVGGKSMAAKALKAKTGWCSGCNGDDTYGFSALPAGVRYNNNKSDHIGSFAYFWSATESTTERSNYVQLQVDYKTANLNVEYKSYGLSVRCVKD